MNKEQIVKQLRDMAKHPTVTLPRDCEALKAAADMIEQAQQVDKEGSPCPEFWDWLPKAYNFDGDGNFTKYNMEVAFFAGKQAIEQAHKQEPVAWITEKISGPTRGYMTVTFNKDTGWKDARSIPLYEHPPQRQPLTNEQLTKIITTMCNTDDGTCDTRAMCRAIEAAHGIKGEA